MLIFIPADDYSSTADQAQAITSLEYEFIQGGDSAIKSFRIGNTNSETVTYTLSHRHVDSGTVGISIDSGSLAANDISDTISVTIDVPPDTISMGFVFDIIASSSTGAESTLEVTYIGVGPNAERRPQYPDRTSSFTDVVSGAIDRAAEWFDVFIYEPVAFVAPDPNDRRISIKTNRDGTQELFWIHNHCERLNPTNPEWGYTLTVDSLRASFQRESRDIVTHFDSYLSQPMSYNTSGLLIIAADQELIRQWALFAPARSNDAAQFKRTVFIIERQGLLYSVEDIVEKYRGQTLSHFEADVVEVHKRNMGSPDFFNPWTRTFRFEDDKPYTQYVCEFDLEALLTAIGSNASLGSNLLGSDVS